MNYPEKITEQVKADMAYAENFEDFAYLRYNRAGVAWSREQYQTLLLNNIGY